MKNQPEDLSKIFAHNLSIILNTLGLTQREVAEKLGCTEQAVSMWIRGKAYPPQKRLYELADVLNVDVRYLVGKLPLTDEEGAPAFEPAPPSPTAAEVFGSPDDDVIPFPGQLATEENVSDFLQKIVQFKDILNKLDKLDADELKALNIFVDFLISRKE